MSNDKTPNFETALGELENIVKTLESGELSLEESLKTFESGIKLTRKCQTSLQEAEQKVTILLEEDGKPTEKTFEQPTQD